MKKPEGAAPRREGRPRSPEADRAIVDATVASIIEQGYEGMTVEGVAARAGVGKATVYRRYATKDDLVIGALEGFYAELPIPDTGSLRGDVETLLAAGGRRAAALSALVLRLSLVADANPDLDRVVRERLLRPRVEGLVRLVERAKARGEVREDADAALFANMVMGTTFWHLVVSPGTRAMDPTFPGRLLDAVLQGAAPAARTADEGAAAPAPDADARAPAKDVRRTRRTL